MKKLMYLLLVALVFACGNRNSGGSSANGNESDARVETSEVSGIINSYEKDEVNDLTVTNDYVFDADASSKI
jgi:hypothetical protein